MLLSGASEFLEQTRSRLVHGCRTRFDYSQKVGREHHHLLRFPGVADGDGSMRVRVLVGADGSDEQEHQHFTFRLWLRSVRQRSIFWMKCLSHQVYAEVCR